MATEFEEEGVRIVKPSISEWRLKEHEKWLFERSDSIPNWRLADKCRRLLADTTSHLSASLPDDSHSKTVAELKPRAREYAAISAGGIAIRSAGSVLVQVGSGYVVEAAGSLRRLIEARMNAEKIVNDRQGDYALRFIEGKASKLSTLSVKGKSRAEIEALNRLTHADTRTLRFLSPRNGARKDGSEVTHGEINITPLVDGTMAESILYVVSYEATNVAIAVCEVFGVGLHIQPWISGELKRLGDLAERIATERATSLKQH